MVFDETSLQGAYIIRMEKQSDNRGFFARAWCRKEFEARGLTAKVEQMNVSLSLKRGTLRGMHYQLPPAAEVKIVRCTSGSVYDVILDLRAGSPSWGRWLGFELTAGNHTMLYVPQGMAHGFQALTDQAEVSYYVSEFYSPEHERGVRYDDPTFGIEWAEPVTVISSRDAGWPNYSTTRSRNIL